MALRRTQDPTLATSPLQPRVHGARKARGAWKSGQMAAGRQWALLKRSKSEALMLLRPRITPRAHSASPVRRGFCVVPTTVVPSTRISSTRMFCMCPGWSCRWCCRQRGLIAKNECVWQAFHSASAFAVSSNSCVEGAVMTVVVHEDCLRIKTWLPHET